MTSEPLEIDAVSPSEIRVGTEVPITITGSGFDPEVRH